MLRKTPLRQCLGCREMRPKADLVRVVKSPSGDIQLDKQGKLPGRGAYLCRNEACLKKTMKTRALERGLSASISINIYETISQQLTTQKEVTHHD